MRDHQEPARVPPEAPALSELLTESAGSARLIFGSADESASAAECGRGGLRCFSHAADAISVGAVLTNDRPSVELLLGAVQAGARLVSLPLPARSADPESYFDFVRAACNAQGVGAIVARDDAAVHLAGAGLPVCPHSNLGNTPLCAPSDRGFELVQFSSGSTQRPKAVRLSDQQLGENVAAILDVVQPEPGHTSVSWLPLSHDMGLLGMLLSSIAAAIPSRAGPLDVVLLDAAQFLRNPSLWLSALSEYSGTVTAAPDFGYRLCAERAAAQSFNLSRLRCAIVGGEIVRASTMTTFVDRFSASGFAAGALCPAYGMAELGLAATMTPVNVYVHHSK